MYNFPKSVKGICPNCGGNMYINYTDDSYFYECEICGHKEG